MPDALKTLVETNRRYSSEYDVDDFSDLSNHLPMALYALRALGADDQRLEDYSTHYVERLSLKPRRHEAIEDDQWTQYLGQSRHESALADYFNERLRNDGVKATLSAVLPTLFVGVAAGAFHPLIRLAYGLEMQHPEEIAEALTYWTIAYLPLPTTGKPLASSEPLAILQELRAGPDLRKGDYLERNLNIFERMEEISAHPRYPDLFHAIDIDDQTLTNLATAGLWAYNAEPDFTVLHWITSCHAMRLVLPYLQQPQTALRYYWTAIATAYLTLRTPALQSDAETPSDQWTDIFRRALDSDDEHVLKFVYTCQQEDQVYPNPLYRVVAADKVDSDNDQT